MEYEVSLFACLLPLLQEEVTVSREKGGRCYGGNTSEERTSLLLNAESRIHIIARVL